MLVLFRFVLLVLLRVSCCVVSFLCRVCVYILGIFFLRILLFLRMRILSFLIDRPVLYLVLALFLLMLFLGSRLLRSDHRFLVVVWLSILLLLVFLHRSLLVGVQTLLRFF